jgi:hypothetical protein
VLHLLTSLLSIHAKERRRARIGKAPTTVADVQCAMRIGMVTSTQSTCPKGSPCSFLSSSGILG